MFKSLLYQLQLSVSAEPYRAYRYILLLVNQYRWGQAVVLLSPRGSPSPAAQSLSLVDGQR